MLTTVESATSLIQSHPFRARTEKVRLENAVGRILAEDLKADRPFPPFDRVMMDGIAIQSTSFFEGNRSFQVENMQAAGDVPVELKKNDNCIEIMTGASLPQGCDAVIPYEQIEIINGVANVALNEIKEFQHIHKSGMDRQAGDILAKKGVKISPAEIAIAATIGKIEMEVVMDPKIAIISTGDELVDVWEDPLPHQIRKSNVHMLSAMVSGISQGVKEFHINDELEEVENALNEIISEYDIIMLSGGVSKGKFDLIPEVLDKIGVIKHFHRVKQRPGKPFWFGTNEDTWVFAFPGNPVSTYMCATRYFLPWWKQSVERTKKSHQTAILAEDFFFKPDLQYFLQVDLSYEPDGRTIARPKPGKGSGDLANLCDAEAFLELPTGRNEFKAGEAFPIWKFRSNE